MCRRRGHGQRHSLLGGPALGARLAGHRLHAVRVIALQRVVVASILGPRLELAAAAVAQAAATTAAVASRQYTAYYEQGFAPWAGNHEVGVDIFLSKLLRDVESEGAVVIVNIPFGRVTEDSMGSVDLFEFVGSFWIVRILIGMVF